MNTIILISAIFLLFFGHLLKAKRWEQFIEIYEQPPRRKMVFSLGIGYLVNFIIPFRVGDIVRAIITGNYLKNGSGFSLATVILDRFLDLMFVGVLFLTFYFLGIGNDEVREGARFYLPVIGILVLLFLSAILFSDAIKKIAKLFCSIFNSKIELKLLFFFWALISTFKDILKVDVLKLLLYTLLMWTFYLLSYFLFAKFWRLHFNESVYFIDIFNQLFSASNIDFSTIRNISINDDFKTVSRLAYYLVPILGLILISKIPVFVSKTFVNYKKIGDKDYLNLLPFEEEIDKFNFLETYFTSSNKNFVNKFIDLNRNISILKDYSGGSNATTMLCLDQDQTFYRKFTLGIDSNKLLNQISWITKNSDKIPLPKIINNVYVDDFCSYDMAYSSTAVDMFTFVHTNPVKESWQLIYSILEKLKTNLYNEFEKADIKTIKNYIDSKATKNLTKLFNSSILSPILKYEYIYINGIKYKNLSLLNNYFTENQLIKIFSNDAYTEIHGDLTIENIIFDNNPNSNENYYLIDPNDGNIHNSPYLDYAKLLQSLHGGYEFLVMTQRVSVRENRIDFLSTRSQFYSELYNLYISYLEENLGTEGLKSVYFHEIIHWLRLMPYKLEKLGDNSLIFYSGLIFVMNDIINKYYE